MFSPRSKLKNKDRTGNFSHEVNTTNFLDFIIQKKRKEGSLEGESPQGFLRVKKLK